MNNWTENWNKTGDHCTCNVCFLWITWNLFLFSKIRLERTIEQIFCPVWKYSVCLRNQKISTNGEWAKYPLCALQKLVGIRLSPQNILSFRIPLWGACASYCTRNTHHFCTYACSYFDKNSQSKMIRRK